MNDVDLSQNSAFIVIDVQKGLDDPYWGRRNNPDAEQNIARLLHVWRRAGMPIYHVRHESTNPNSPLRPGYSGSEIKEIVAPVGDEPVLAKRVNSAFIGTDLEARLRQSGQETVVITGLTTDHCVSTTARMAANLGFKVYLVTDATATFERVGPNGTRYSAEEIHNMELAVLNAEFADLISTQELLDRLGEGTSLQRDRDE